MRPSCPRSSLPALRQIVQHCLEKEASRRFHSANDLGFALRTVSTSDHRFARQQRQPARAWFPHSPTQTPLGVARDRRRPGSRLLAALAIPHFLELDPIDLAAYRFIPFANDHEAESGAAWSPDGKSIAYLKTVDGIPQLMVRGLGSSHRHPTHEIQDARCLGLLVAGFRVVYCINREGKGELWGDQPFRRPRGQDPRGSL